ncbi:Vesicle transport protein SFT2B [Trichinella pseudospiralis]|uniref:Vesicle transport protein n=1 Tax=Trichinella pseudospiralis TaxID=6337 RepID=A0A0V1FVP3_TRIPS|nr:Vesicle transport protein SFT2B [Trichinella pseudospiralis]
MRFLTKIFSSNEEEEEEDIISDVTSGYTLSWSTRIKCFIFCFLFGIFLSVMGSVSVFFRNFVMFSILFSIGSVMSMASTCFLMGPVKQLKKMVDPTRWISTVIVLLMIILTLFSAFYVRHFVCLVSAVCDLPISGDDLVLFVVYSIREIRREKLLANVRLIIDQPHTQLRTRLLFHYSRRQNKKSVHNSVYTVDVTSCPVKLNNRFNFNFTSNIQLDIYFNN